MTYPFTGMLTPGFPVLISLTVSASITISVSVTEDTEDCPGEVFLYSLVMMTGEAYVPECLFMLYPVELVPVVSFLTTTPDFR